MKLQYDYGSIDCWNCNVGNMEWQQTPKGDICWQNVMVYGVFRLRSHKYNIDKLHNLTNIINPYNPLIMFNYFIINL